MAHYTLICWGCQRVQVRGCDTRLSRTATGREWETRFVHVITTGNGKIQRFEAYVETAGAVEAHRE